MEAMPGIDRCMFATSDQPLLRKETVAALSLASKNDSNAIWRTSCEGTHGSPVVFPRWSFPELLDLPEGKGGGFVVKKYPEHLHTVNVRDMYELKDVDSPEDLSELLER
jgi:molybdenum cofactor cytidylyltransferase